MREKTMEIVHVAKHHLNNSLIFEESRPDRKAFFRDQCIFWSDKLDVAPNGVVTNRDYIPLKQLDINLSRYEFEDREKAKEYAFYQMLAAIKWTCRTFNVPETAALAREVGNPVSEMEERRADNFCTETETSTTDGMRTWSLQNLDFTHF
jgi:hypothetical protein